MKGKLNLCIILACNILASDILALYHLSNYDYRRNCSLATLFPAAITVTQMRVGNQYWRNDLEEDIFNSKVI